MRRGRLAFVGVLLAAAMAGAAVTVAYGLATGFDRAARQADLPDVIVSFRAESRDEIDRIVSALPNVAARAYRLEFTDVGVSGNDLRGCQDVSLSRNSGCTCCTAGRGAAENGRDCN